MSNYGLVRIKEADDWIIDYNPNSGEYRISYFEDNHFKDEVFFMSTKKNLDTEIIIACPHCKVCSIKLTREEYDLVKSGQQMVEVCQVCGKEIIINV